MVRYPGYPGSTPYSGSTIQITSNCSGPNVDVGIRPDPYADLTFFVPTYESYVPTLGTGTTVPLGMLGIPIGGAVAPSSGTSGSPFASYPSSATTYGAPSADSRVSAYPGYGWSTMYPGSYPAYPGYAAAPGYGGWPPYGYSYGYGYGYGYPGMAPYAAGYGVLPGTYPGWIPGGYPTYP
ncbi:MAG TPA: hypothetical protein VNM50_08475 [Chloroflexota bacterium]|nr:hypothetical protein [Chloroflexota bacterium]